MTPRWPRRARRGGERVEDPAAPAEAATPAEPATGAGPATGAEPAAAAQPAAAEPAAAAGSLQELAAMAESLLAQATELRVQTEALADELEGGARPG